MPGNLRDHLVLIRTRVERSVLRAYPHVWLLSAHLVVTGWALFVALVYVVLFGLEIESCGSIPRVVECVWLLYIVCFWLLIHYGRVVSRRVSAYVAAPISIMWMCVGATLVSALLVSPPVIVYGVFYRRMDHVLHWSDGSLCADIRAVETLLDACSRYSANPVGVGYSGLGTQVQFLPLERAVFTGTPPIGRLGRFQWESSEYISFGRCHTPIAGEEFGVTLRKATEVLQAHGLVGRSFMKRSERFYGADIASSEACEHVNRLPMDGPEHATAHFQRDMLVASRGPWIFRSFDLVLFLLAAGTGPFLFLQHVARPRLRRRVSAVAALVLGGPLVFELSIYSVRNFMLISLYAAGALVALYSVCVGVAVLSRSRPRMYSAGSYGASVAIIISPIISILIAWLALRWGVPGHHGYANIFLTIEKDVVFDPQLVTKYMPETLQRVLDFYLAQALGLFAIVFSLGTLALVARLLVQTQAEPD